MSSDSIRRMYESIKSENNATGSNRSSYEDNESEKALRRMIESDPKLKDAFEGLKKALL